MSDVFSHQQRSFIMAQVHSKNTSLEIKIRKQLFKLGYRFRIHAKDLPGQPDLKLPKYKTIIAINGCFWHGHNCPRVKMPESNREYWKAKIIKNKKRDKSNIKNLTESGWACIVIWECAAKQKYAENLYNSITSFLPNKKKFLMIGESRKGNLVKSYLLKDFLQL